MGVGRQAPVSSKSAGVHGRTSLLPELALLTTVGLWASTFIIMKDTFNHITPMAFIFVRFLLMTLLAFGVLAVLVWRGDERRLAPARGDLPRFVLAGLTGYTFYQLGFSLGLDRTSVFSASLLISTVPLFTIIFLAVMGDRSPLLAWTGLGIALAGVTIFLFNKQGGDRSLEGDLLSIGAAIAFAVYGIANRPLARDYPAASYTAYSMLFGTIPLLLAGLPAALDQHWTGLPVRSWFALAYVVVFPVYVAYMLWNYGIAHRGAAVASSFGLLAPILSGALSAVIFHEQFGLRKIVGGALVLLGLFVIRVGGTANRSRGEPPPIQEVMETRPPELEAAPSRT
jgi:drug/metabolite transporter (DMT)-like permease